MLRHVGLLGAIVPALHITVGYMVPLFTPPVPQKLGWDCEWVNWMTGSWDTWLSKWMTLMVVVGAVLFVAGAALMIAVAKLKAGNKVTDWVFGVMFWTGIVILLVTLVLPKMTIIPCNPFA